DYTTAVCPQPFQFGRSLVYRCAQLPPRCGAPTSPQARGSTHARRASHRYCRFPTDQGRTVMPGRSAMIALAAAPCAAMSAAEASQAAQDPDRRGQCRKTPPPGQPGSDPSKPRGRGQEAPLTPEYQAVFAANPAALAAGGEGLWPGFPCRPPGMPALMTLYEP